MCNPCAELPKPAETVRISGGSPNPAPAAPVPSVKKEKPAEIPSGVPRVAVFQQAATTLQTIASGWGHLSLAHAGSLMTVDANYGWPLGKAVSSVPKGYTMPVDVPHYDEGKSREPIAGHSSEVPRGNHPQGRRQPTRDHAPADFFVGRPSDTPALVHARSSSWITVNTGMFGMPTAKQNWLILGAALLAAAALSAADAAATVVFPVVIRPPETSKDKRG